MDDVDLAPTVGIVACLLTLAILAWPYLRAPAGSVNTYYGSGAITPLAAGLFALVSVIVFAAGREGRSDPALTAGAALVFGLFIAVICVVWAFTARVDVLVSPGRFLPLQRWVLAAVSLTVPASAAWYTRALRLL